MRRQRLELYELPDYIPRKNKSNDYGFDPHEQEHETYTGMGADINVHDQWACESMGAIQDRTKEHLGQSDKAITAYRRLLRQAIEDTEERRPAADGARPAERAEAHRPGRDRRHRSRPTTGRAIGRRPISASARPQAGPTAIDRDPSMAQRKSRSRSELRRSPRSVDRRAAPRRSRGRARSSRARSSKPCASRSAISTACCAARRWSRRRPRARCARASR